LGKSIVGVLNLSSESSQIEDVKRIKESSLAMLAHIEEVNLERRELKISSPVKDLKEKLEKRQFNVWLHSDFIWNGY
jgi:hypothetical protein